MVSPYALRREYRFSRFGNCSITLLGMPKLVSSRDAGFPPSPLAREASDLHGLSLRLAARIPLFTLRQLLNHTLGDAKTRFQQGRWISSQPVSQGSFLVGTGQHM